MHDARARLTWVFPNQFGKTIPTLVGMKCPAYLRQLFLTTEHWRTGIAALLHG